MNQKIMSRKAVQALSKRISADKRKLHQEELPDLMLKIIQDWKLEQKGLVGASIEIPQKHRDEIAKKTSLTLSTSIHNSDQWNFEPTKTYTFEPWLFDSGSKTKATVPKWVQDFEKELDSEIPLPNYLIHPDPKPTYYSATLGPVRDIPTLTKQTKSSQSLYARFEKKHGKGAKYVSTLGEMKLAAQPEIDEELLPEKQSKLAEEWDAKTKKGEVGLLESILKEYDASQKSRSPMTGFAGSPFLEDPFKPDTATQ